MANPLSSRKSLRQQLAVCRRRLDDLKRQLSEARMLEALSQQLDPPEALLERTRVVAALEEDIAKTHKSLNALNEEYTVRFGDDADVLRIRGPEEREREEKEDQVRRLQTELVSVARKLADLKADLPDELELFYSIKHARGRYGDARATGASTTAASTACAPSTWWRIERLGARSPDTTGNRIKTCDEPCRNTRLCTFPNEVASGGRVAGVSRAPFTRGLHEGSGPRGVTDPTNQPN
jgi:hypothetical protein